MRKNAEEVFNKLFPDALVIPYKTPGIKLSQEYYCAVHTTMNPAKIIFLLNHGVIITGKTAEEIIKLHKKVTRCFSSRLIFTTTNFTTQ